MIKHPGSPPPQGKLPWGLFFLSLSLIVVGAGTPSTGVSRPSGLVALYGQPQAHAENAFVAQFGVRGGRPIRVPLALGRLGLVGQINALVSRGSSWQATVGTKVVWGQNHRIVGQMKVPDGATVTSLGWSGSSLFGIQADVTGGRLKLMRFGSDHRDYRVGSVPAGIATIWQGRDGPYVSVIDPNLVVWYGDDGAKTSKVLSGVAASFWMGYRGNQGLVAYSQGQSRFGWAWLSLDRIRRITTTNPRRAVLGVTDSSKIWGFGAFGVVPLEHDRFDFQRISAWPGPMPTTLSVVQNQGRWCLFLGGAGQGYWFDTATGRFGPSFRLGLPTGTVIRQIALLTTG